MDDTFGALSIAAGAKFVIAPPLNHADRNALVLGSLSNGGPPDLTGNDLILYNTDPATIFTQLKAGLRPTYNCRFLYGRC